MQAESPTGRTNVAVPETVPPAQPREDERGEDAALVIDDLLVEDVSIDGMCGVY
jgi:mycofactocin precursor